MANSHEILFVRRNSVGTETPKITHIGGKLSEGVEWSIPCEEAISGIQSGRFEFFIQNDAGNVEKLKIGRHRKHGPYLRLENDELGVQSLLDLPCELEENN